jgi:hypothetical protein
MPYALKVNGGEVFPFVCARIARSRKRSLGTGPRNGPTSSCHGTGPRRVGPSRMPDSETMSVICQAAELFSQVGQVPR